MATKVMIQLACLSPDDMRISVEIGRYAAAFALGITLVSTLLSCRQRDLTWLPLCLLLLLVHPAWTMDVFRGECGNAKRFMSGVISLGFIGVISCQIFNPRFSRLRFLFIGCVASWIAYGFSILNRFLIPPAEGVFSEVVQGWVFSHRDLFRIAVVLSVICSIIWVFIKMTGGRKGPNISLE
jgi:hypothetical protein